MLDFKETNSLEFIAYPKLNTWNNQYSNPLDLLVKLIFVRALHLMDMELPDSWATTIQSLTELRYLALYVKQFELKWISHLHNLQTLQLKVLENNDQESFEESSTTMLENMKSFGTCDICLDNMNARFWWTFPNLEELGLSVKDVLGFPLFPIPKVHTHLHFLSLQFSLMELFNSVGWERSESYFWDVTNVEFPALKYLALFPVTIEEWKASEESFPMIEKLVISGCYNSKEIPPSFADIPTLRLIELTNCIDSLGVSSMNIRRGLEENTGCDSLRVVIEK
ncbi:hypothetical protein KY290_019449 [Solanum tuberosum]|uniref:Uncharacterized protein n=1 Tax=Solanum tuberosum TaxID=4113 RepID=A0ABQ7VH64_SOLTU|nr:hypothetical protein KY284_016183 [Solanum tuberosum]KAH0704123.1 hypothetical protein KY285_018401 [Solanum tuberosum]KAH0763376.1 hypothetical protein KY290_019449 [Solanum tuberosum]